VDENKIISFLYQAGAAEFGTRAGLCDFAFVMLLAFRLFPKFRMVLDEQSKAGDKSAKKILEYYVPGPKEGAIKAFICLIVFIISVAILAYYDPELFSREPSR
jgi:hypothetical protein